MSSAILGTGNIDELETIKAELTHTSDWLLT